MSESEIAAEVDASHEMPPYEDQEESPTRMITMCICVAGVGGFVFGYDLGVIVGALPALVEQFDLSPAWEGMVVAGASLGQVCGAIVGGHLTDKLGRKTMIRAQCFALSAGSILVATSSGVAQLLIGRIIMGFGFAWGVLSNVAWVSEIVPAAYRGRGVSAYELTITIGLFVALLVNSADVSWRLLVVLSIPASIIQFLCFVVVPESPVWLLSQGRDEEAQEAIKRIGGGEVHMQQIRDTVSKPIPHFRTALKEWRIPFYAVLCIQALGLLTGGINIRIYAIRIFNSVGVTGGLASRLAVGLGVVKVSTTLLSVLKLDAYGRRVFYMCGMSLLIVSCVGIALGASMEGCHIADGCEVDNKHEMQDFCGSCPAYCGGCNGGAQFLVVAGCFMGYIAYQVSFGPVNFAVGSEMFPSEARARFLGVQTVTQGVFQLITTLLFPVLREAIGLSAAILFHTVFCVVGLVFVATRMVETKGKSPEEILSAMNELWKRTSVLSHIRMEESTRGPSGSLVDSVDLHRSFSGVSEGGGGGGGGGDTAPREMQEIELSMTGIVEDFVTPQESVQRTPETMPLGGGEQLQS